MRRRRLEFRRSRMPSQVDERKAHRAYTLASLLQHVDKSSLFNSFPGLSRFVLVQCVLAVQFFRYLVHFFTSPMCRRHHACSLLRSSFTSLTSFQVPNFAVPCKRSRCRVEGEPKAERFATAGEFCRFPEQSASITCFTATRKTRGNSSIGRGVMDGTKCSERCECSCVRKHTGV